MKLKICPICPTCRAPHDTEVDPGTKVKCPDCEQVYRAESPEPTDAAGQPQDRSPTARVAARAEEPPPAKKKASGRKSNKLGKLIERFAPTQNRAALLALAIGGIVVGVIINIVALVGVGQDARPWVLGVGGMLLLVALVCLLRLQFGGSRAFFDGHKKGVRFKRGKLEQFLFWEEMETIDIQREIQGPGGRGAGSVKYEVYLIGSETIHLTRSFLGSLDDPTALIKALKRYSGKDFETMVG